MDQSGQIDKARLDHWESVWQGAEMPAPMSVDSKSLNDYPARCFDEFFSNSLSKWPQRENARVIELGCGRSVWLPYFATSLSLEVAGLDYSATGCEQARAILERDGIEGDIRLGDLFDPPGDLLESFDLVTSFGLVEHFVNTSDCLGHCAAFSKPGGIVVTMIPNMLGLNGFLTRLINRPVFDLHVAMDEKMLRLAHKEAGMKVIDSCYLMPINLNVVYPPAQLPGFVRTAVVRLFSWASKAVWLLDSHIVRLPATRLFSPYIMCIAQKPG